MVRYKLFLIKILLVAAILHLAVAFKNERDSKNSLTTKKAYRPLNEKNYNLQLLQKLFKHSKKSKRSSYRRQWQPSSVDYGFGKYNNNNKYNGPAPYLVYNRKTGTYYPYYNYPKDNAVRRNGYNHRS